MPDIRPDPSIIEGQNATCLRELPFMDLYLRIDKVGEARYRTPARDFSNLWSRPLPKKFMPEAERVAALAKSDMKAPDASFVYDGMRFRLSFQKLATGAEWVILRRIKSAVPTLEELNYAPHIISMLRSLGRRDGLILMAGATGHGKTTTSFALVKDYLERNGGVCLTVEDPVEYILDGEIGAHGYSYQVQVENEDWATPLKRTLRWTPRYILVGEVRSPAAAEQILRAATTGHLVVTTIHAGSIEESLHGLMHLAEQSMGRSANAILAQGLTAAIHQMLGPQCPYIRYAITEEGNNGDAIRSLIREDKIGMINTYIDKQIAKMNSMIAPESATNTLRLGPNETTGKRR